ncbi:hypothetical protein O1L55_36630 [Streptomyces albulus]|nr:hypothetical protein [Streptomyces noursei]
MGRRPRLSAARIRAGLRAGIGIAVRTKAATKLSVLHPYPHPLEFKEHHDD